MAETQNASFPFLSILFLIFVTLKLCDILAWSWFWVLSPLWAPLLLALFLFGFAFVLSLLAR